MNFDRTDKSFADSEFEDRLIAEVSDAGDSFTMDNGWSFFCDKKYGVALAPGQRVRLWGRGVGYPVRGLAIDGKIVYYRTKEQDEADHREQVARRQQQKRDDFETKRNEYDTRIAALPGPFRARIERFQATGPDWRWEFEPYELFCCEEAALLVTHARDARGVASPAEWVRAFAKASTDAQRKLAPTMKLGEHSGNTFGCTVQLACAYLEDETLVPQLHGALAPLVGCEEYGCHRKGTAPTT